MRNKTIAILSAIILIAVCSCSDEALQMDSIFLHSYSRAERTDEVAIQLSTFRTDSVLTSSQGVVWVGRANKPILGDICSSSFIKLCPPSRTGTMEWLKKERYDSVEIVLRHTGSYEGDTMQNLVINVNHLKYGPIKLNKSDTASVMSYDYIRFAESQTSFYNVDSFHVGKPIGRHLFKPRPHAKPRITFRLDDDFGKSLVEFIKNNKVADDNVSKYFYEKVLGGINISADKNAKSLCAFRSDSVQIILHTHVSDITNTKRTRVLTITEPEKQFNHVWNENMDKPYDTLTSLRRQVTEQEGGFHSAQFEGLGYYTRINFPALNTVLDQNLYAHVVKATLTLYADRKSIDKYRVPPTFFLSEINEFNVEGSPVINSNRNIVFAQRQYDTFDLDNISYTFDLTYYINTRLSNEYLKPTEGLYLTWGGSMNPMNYNFMSFMGHEVPVGMEHCRSKLEITYYYYDREDR